MKPNLFIVGAPKCGTTALAAWLGEHPNVFFSGVKEPHYFSSEYRLTKSLREYEALFAPAQMHHHWRAEASVWHMYSPGAAEEILRYNPDARVVAMVRNPAEMVPSMHRQQLFNGNELLVDLKEAVAQCGDRLSGSRRGVAKGYPPDHLAYLHSCALGWQLKRLFERVPPGQRHVIVFDDLKADPAGVFRGVLDFLGLSDGRPTDFRPVNAAKARRYPWMDRVVRNVGRWKSRVGIKPRLHLLSGIRRWNRREQPIERLSPDLRRQIVDAMRSDIALLGDTLGRDLSHWTQ